MNRLLLAFSIASLTLAACIGREENATPVPSVPPPIIAEASPAAPSASGTPSGEKPAPIRLRAGMVAPRRLSGDLSAIARLSDSGNYSWSTCFLEAVVSKEGKVTEVRWLRPKEAAPEARAAITGAILSWRFVPALTEGKPVAIYYNLSINHCPCILKSPAV